MCCPGRTPGAAPPGCGGRQGQAAEHPTPRRGGGGRPPPMPNARHPTPPLGTLMDERKRTAGAGQPLPVSGAAVLRRTARPPGWHRTGGADPRPRPTQHARHGPTLPNPPGSPALPPGLGRGGAWRRRGGGGPPPPGVGPRGSGVVQTKGHPRQLFHHPRGWGGGECHSSKKVASHFL